MIRAWTKDEDKVLIEAAPALTFGEMTRRDMFPGRSKSSLIARYRRICADPKPKLAAPPKPPKPRAPSVSVLSVISDKTSIPLPKIKDAYRPHTPKSIFDLEPNDCRYPIPANGPISHVFCGEPVVAKTSYCKKHASCAIRGSGLPKWAG